MIFFGTLKKDTERYGFKFLVEKKTAYRDSPHIKYYYIIFRCGRNRFYVGANRVKRIIKDRVYELDGVRIYKFGEHDFRRN